MPCFFRSHGNKRAKDVEKLANFEAYMKILLLPLSGLYHIGLKIRHLLFDWHLLPSKRFDHPVICIGNLCFGGSGKTPLTEYIVKLLSRQYRTCIISRGYGRRSKGCIIAHPDFTYEEIGDEPSLYVNKFPDVQVAVCTDRSAAVQKMLDSTTPPQVFVLDDAFQHRRISPGLNILLTEYGNLYTDDHLVPAGTLRDIPSAAQRANIVVVTKSPVFLNSDEKTDIRLRLKLLPSQRLFFSHLCYGDLTPLNEAAKSVDRNKARQMVAFCGIARPEAFFSQLKNLCPHIVEFRFRDHHPFTEKDIKTLTRAFEALESDHKIMVTTEKDAMRLIKSAYFCHFNSVPLFALPVEAGFNTNETFYSEIDSYVREYFRHHQVH